MKRFEPVAAISKMRYDETPLRLTLREQIDFLECEQDEALRVLQKAGATPYMYAKILRLEWTLGFLTLGYSENRLFCHTALAAGLPCVTCSEFMRRIGSSD